MPTLYTPFDRGLNTRGFGSGSMKWSIDGASPALATPSHRPPPRDEHRASDSPVLQRLPAADPRSFLSLRARCVDFVHCCAPRWSGHQFGGCRDERDNVQSTWDGASARTEVPTVGRRPARSRSKYASVCKTKEARSRPIEVMKNPLVMYCQLRPGEHLCRAHHSPSTVNLIRVTRPSLSVALPQI